jgi:hypothetical protein
MATFTLDQESYEALIAFAQRGVARNRDGSINQTQALALDGLLKYIERQNSITRHSLWVQWQDPTAPLPPGVRFPQTWPPELRQFIQFISRPITQNDVLSMVAQRTPNAVTILVTPDPAALLGWTPVAEYFAQQPTP